MKGGIYLSAPVSGGGGGGDGEEGRLLSPLFGERRERGRKGGELVLETSLFWASKLKGHNICPVHMAGLPSDSFSMRYEHGGRGGEILEILAKWKSDWIGHAKQHGTQIHCGEGCSDPELVLFRLF